MAGHKKKRPTFVHYPSQRAKVLKHQWVQSAKLKSRWKADRRRQDIRHARDAPGPETTTDTKNPGNDLDVQEQASEQPPENPTTADSPPSLRDLERKAYAPSSLHTYRATAANRKHSTGPVSHDRKGQPNMKLRMGAMLERIKRDFA